VHCSMLPLGQSHEHTRLRVHLRGHLHPICSAQMPRRCIVPLCPCPSAPLHLCTISSGSAHLLVYGCTKDTSIDPEVESLLKTRGCCPSCYVTPP
jgi:hypothetical protein